MKLFVKLHTQANQLLQRLMEIGWEENKIISYLFNLGLFMSLFAVL